MRIQALTLGLGVNWNHGSKICLRLRYPGDKNQFLPYEEVLGTMLHELCHNAIGPHNAAFHELNDTLRDELEGLMMKGYTGEGFLGAGQRLGGSRRMPHDEARRLARQAAEGRQRGPASTGHRLGGTAPRPGKDMRRVIADAAQRRNEALKGCATDNMDEKQIRDLADTATRNGFRTQAEEDEANEVAIAQAMWELVQEDEKVKHGKDYVLPTPQNPAGSGSDSFASSSGYGQGSNNQNPSTSDAPPGTFEDLWVCNVCTLHNPRNFLACDACGTERSGRQAKEMLQRAEAKRPETSKAAGTSKSKKPAVVDLTASPPQKRDEKRRRVDGPIQEPLGPYVPPFWHCRACGTKMEKRWWTCSGCGRMKESS